MNAPLEQGKLPAELLERLLAHTSHAPGIVVGAACGEDAAVVAGADTLVLTADPITFTQENIGAYIVAVNANDVVAMGGTPRYLTTTVLLPPGTPARACEPLFSDIAAACAATGMLWVGGHTEVTSAVNRIVVSGHAAGFLRGAPLTTAGAKPGDVICMTKWIGLEGSTLIAREKPEECRAVLGKGRYDDVVAWLRDPGICIVAEGEALAGLELSSGHDPTEGGVSMGIREICVRSKVGALIDAHAVPVRNETRDLCAHFGLDPMALLSSGVFLFTAAPEVAEKALSLLGSRHIPAAQVGEIRPAAAGILIRRDGRTEELRASVRDEIVKLEKA